MIKFNLPNIHEYNHENCQVIRFGDDKKWGYELYINGEQFMTYEFRNGPLYELFSHNYFAHGHVITTGLGFGFREMMLINNPKVKSVTTIEKSAEVIKFHEDLNPDLVSKINIINTDADTYEGSCDTLLVDHYELNYSLDIIKNCLSNIKCKTLWWWGFEFLYSYQQFLNLKKKYVQLPDVSELEYQMIKHVYSSRDYDELNSIQ